MLLYNNNYLYKSHRIYVCIENDDQLLINNLIYKWDTKIKSYYIDEKKLYECKFMEYERKRMMKNLLLRLKANHYKYIN